MDILHRKRTVPFARNEALYLQSDFLLKRLKLSEEETHRGEW